MAFLKSCTVASAQVDQMVFRGIAQSGSAPALGAGCREFKSLYPDHFFGKLG